MKPIIISFYMANTPRAVIDAQAEVVAKMAPGITFLQVNTRQSHGESIDIALEMLLPKMDKDLLVLLDIDAIPLRESSIPTLINMTCDGIRLAGAPQASNHLAKPWCHDIFVAPCVMALSRLAWISVGKPSAVPTDKSDVAQEITRRFQEVADPREVPVTMDIISYDGRPHPVKLPDGRVDAPPFWKLGSRGRYGLNTIYGIQSRPLFFHSFQSFAPGQNERFIATCKKVLDGSFSF
jgi:hypothetical protein